MNEEDLKWALLTVADPMSQRYADIKNEGLREPMVEIERFMALMNKYYYEQMRIQAKVKTFRVDPDVVDKPSS